MDEFWKRVEQDIDDMTNSFLGIRGPDYRIYANACIYLGLRHHLHECKLSTWRDAKRGLKSNLLRYKSELEAEIVKLRLKSN